MKITNSAFAQRILLLSQLDWHNSMAEAENHVTSKSNNPSSLRTVAYASIREEEKKRAGI